MDVSGLCGGGEEETCWDTAGPRVADLGNNLMEIIFSALGILRRKYLGAEDRAVAPMVKNVNIRLA